MSITVTMSCLQSARTSDTAAERLGYLTTAQETLKAAVKAARQAALDEAAGQESLPMGAAGGR